MAEIANAGAEDIAIRTLAMQITAGAMQKDYRTEACLCLAFARDRIRYVRDMRNVEVIQVPRRTLQLGAGDCDDKTVLLASMLSSIGHRTRFVAIAQIPDEFVHVWLQSYCHGKWLDLEPTEPIDCGERVPTTGVVDTLYCEL